MLNNRVPIIIVSVVIVISMVIGGVLLFIDRDEPIDPIDPSITDAPIDDNFGVTLDPSTGNYVIEFDEENEVFLDTSLIAYLERMEQGVPDIDENGNYYLYNDGDLVYDESQEKDLEGVLDNIILLINHFAKREYSMDASHQIQRFYVEHYDRFVGVTFDEMANKMAECFPSGGADPEELNDKVIEVFGFNRGDECAFVFSPLTLAEVKVEFYNVMPLEIEVTDEMESLCIYDSWYHEEDDGYERNLEAWLKKVVIYTMKGEERSFLGGAQVAQQFIRFIIREAVTLEMPQQLCMRYGHIMRPRSIPLPLMPMGVAERQVPSQRQME